MQPHEILNGYLSQLIADPYFIATHKKRVIEENQKKVPIWSSIDIFTQHTCDIEALQDAAALMVHMENPSEYLLIDIIKHYITDDSRFHSIRRTIPFYQET